MQSRETRFVLRIESGERQGEQVPLGDGTLQVGRRPECGLVLKDGSVSGKHAELRVAGERIELVDLGSTNGTRVSGQKIEQAVLSHGDSLLFGNIKATLHDVHFAGQVSAPETPAPSGAPAPAEATGSLGRVSAEKVTRSGAGSKRPLFLILALVVVGAGAFAYLRFLRPGGGPIRARAAVPSVPGNLVTDGSFEEGTNEWVAAETAPVAFQRERAFARSGDLGLGVRLEEGAWSLARSTEITLPARRSLACAASLRVEEASEGRFGVELSSSTGALPPFLAWRPAQHAGGGFEELQLAFDVPGGYDRARLVVFGRGRGSVALDDVSALEHEPLGRAVKFTEYELSILGEPGSTAVFLRSGRPLLTGFDLSSLEKAGPEGWGDAKLEAKAGPRGFELAFPGAPKDARLAFTGLRPDEPAGGEGAWVATTGPGGYAAYGGDFKRAGVTSLLLGGGTELLRLGFAQPVEVEATLVPGGMTFRIALGGLESCEMQLAFSEERAGAAALADRAIDAERKKDLGKALAAWTELLDKFPFERKLVTQASEARARLIQAGLNLVEELRREMERARFFLLPELFQKGEARAQALAAQYQGSEVEVEAQKVVTLCQRARTELNAGDRSGDARCLEGVLQALDPKASPNLVQHVREALASGTQTGGGVDTTRKGD